MSDIPTINIDLDKKCSQCGQPGVLPNGICLKCAAENIKRRNNMDFREINLNIDKVEEISLSSKTVTEFDKQGTLTDSYVLTTVKLEIKCVPGKFDDLLSAIADGHTIKVSFRSPQLAMAGIQ